jgi:hypothetical protein
VPGVISRLAGNPPRSQRTSRYVFAISPVGKRDRSLRHLAIPTLREENRNEKETSWPEQCGSTIMGTGTSSM